MLGNQKRSAVRRNFDIAHELGHLLLHYRRDFANLERKEHKELEDEANLFAGAFLLPETAFKRDMVGIARPTNPDAYLDLKQKWMTSIQVLAYRAAKLNMLTPKEHRNFYAALHRRGYLKIEPLDDELPVQRPQKMQAILDLVARKDILDIRTMIEEDWKADIEFFHHLTGIEPAFFKKFMKSKRDYNMEQVTDINSLRAK